MASYRINNKILGFVIYTGIMVAMVSDQKIGFLPILAKTPSFIKLLEPIFYIFNVKIE